MTDAGIATFSHIDRFSIFNRTLGIEGWLFSPTRNLVRLELRFARGASVSVLCGLPSQDVEAAYGAEAADCRFALYTSVEQPDDIVINATLFAWFSDGTTATLDDLGTRDKGSEPAHRLTGKFIAITTALPPGNFLEIGARARSGNTYRQFVPAGWNYVGFDMRPGDNVDVVGDAHALASYFSPESFQAAMAISVFEHLLMPWKFVLELNRVLSIGGVGYFMTHQTYAVHDAPWDFWRFSNDAWPALFNRATGFEVLEAHVGEPAFIVPVRCSPGHAADAPGYLSSSVLVRKIGHTTLRWDVDLSEVIESPYPA
ncbi:hypothetical protein WPS_29370 [Vulcanimicrobium alpinum]|uniref:Methyltransferase type 11 domain-containing protein n=1 Tax=Vulcanimicrobium alpinum TaxID=3016050 RepID=A0AAN2CAZ6_UNVUL|nr:methyltransferase domain-containing protein [Vulcanimicrobium alpinum]BDE07661.1 hypothetical protein WPS_29370 [Vulcanimicrobium alpinum]